LENRPCSPLDQLLPCCGLVSSRLDGSDQPHGEQECENSEDPTGKTSNRTASLRSGRNGMSNEGGRTRVIFILDVAAR